MVQHYKVIMSAHCHMSMDTHADMTLDVARMLQISKRTTKTTKETKMLLKSVSASDQVATWWRCSEPVHLIMYGSICVQADAGLIPRRGTNMASSKR